MATRRALTTKRKKIRSSNRIKAADEKHVGSEIIDWSGYTSYEDAKMDMYWTLRHYAYYYAPKDAKTWVMQYAKKHMPKMVAALKRVPDNAFTTSVGGRCKMIENGAPYSKEQIDKHNNDIINLTEKAVEEVVGEAKPAVKRTVSPAERVRNKTIDMITDIEEQIDANNDINVYNALVANNCAYVTAKAIYDKYEPLHAEIEELVTKKTKDLVEAYSNIPVKSQKHLLKTLTTMLDDCQKYMSSKKATRAVRKPKVKTAAQQTSKVKYCKTNNEYKISSVDPQKIIGSEKVVLFDVAKRTATILLTSNAKGFSIKGTTIQNIDSAKKKKIRKPEEFLSAMLKSTKAGADKLFNAIKTKPSDGNGRLSDNTIILKVY